MLPFSNVRFSTTAASALRRDCISGNRFTRPSKSLLAWQKATLSSSSCFMIEAGSNKLPKKSSMSSECVFYLLLLLYISEFNLSNSRPDSNTAIQHVKCRTPSRDICILCCKWVLLPKHGSLSWIRSIVPELMNLYDNRVGISINIFNCQIVTMTMTSYKPGMKKSVKMLCLYSYCHILVQQRACYFFRWLIEPTSKNADAHLHLVLSHHPCVWRPAKPFYTSSHHPTETSEFFCNVMGRIAKPAIKYNRKAFWKHVGYLLFSRFGNLFHIRHQRVPANTWQLHVFAECYTFEEAKWLKVECYTLQSSKDCSDFNVHAHRLKNCSQFLSDYSKLCFDLIAVVRTNIVTGIGVTALLHHFGATHRTLWTTIGTATVWEER